MNTIELLDALQQKALGDENLKNMLLATRKGKNPLSTFCRKCQELGYAIYEMDLIQAGGRILRIHEKKYKWRRRKLPYVGR